MDLAKRHEIEQECSNLVLRSALYLDTHNHAWFAGLFTEDGLWDRVDQPLTGPGENLPFLEARTSTTLVRHVITNLLVNVESEVAATAIAYVLNFQTSGDTIGAVPETPAPMVSPGLIAEWHDSFALTNDGWRISRRHTDAIFRKS